MDFASGEDLPLTLIVGENASGKTSLLRALSWCLYGERSLPGTTFGVHPVWWTPEDGAVDTRVKLDFRTERHAYRLVRTVSTEPRHASSRHDDDYRRRDERLQLMERHASGSLKPLETDPKLIAQRVESMLRFGLREILFLDMDQAINYAGGSDAKPLDPKVVREKTTAAVDELLGLGAFDEARKRVESIQAKLSSDAARRAGDRSLDEDQKEFDKLQEEREKDDSSRKRAAEAADGLEQQRDSVRERLLVRVRGTGEPEKLQAARDNARKELERLERQKQETLTALARETEAPDLLAGLMSSRVSRVREALEPLRRSGVIPMGHLGFVREWMRDGICICGESLAPGTESRRRVEELLDTSSVQEQTASDLDHAHEACRELVRMLRSDSPDWSRRVKSARTQLGEIDTQAGIRASELKEAEARLEAEGTDEVQSLREQEDALEGRIRELRDQVVELDMSVQGADKVIEAKKRSLEQRKRGNLRARELQAAADLAELVGKAIDSAYESIRRDQVAELSEQMNNLFTELAYGVRKSDFGHVEEGMANLRLIQQVGVEEVANSPGSYQIFTRNRQGGALRTTEINGASRRVLALSFVLALCDAAGAQVPLWADSMLNNLSGRVRTNSFRKAVEISAQTILTVTRADLEPDADFEVANQLSGKTYVLTNHQGADVVRTHSEPLASHLCECGPRQYCDACERLGDDARRGWRRRAGSEVSS